MGLSFGNVIARSELHGWKKPVIFSVGKMEIPKEVLARSTKETILYASRRRRVFNSRFR